MRTRLVKIGEGNIMGLMITTWIVLSAAVGLFAMFKGRSFLLFCILSLLLTPVIIFIVLLIIGEK